MSRTANTPATPAEAPELLPAVVSNIQAAQNSAPSISEQEEMMNLGRQIGQIETASFIGNISDGVILSAYENVKKSKAWTRLTSKKDGNTFPNLDAFCQERLGYSARRLAQIVGNRELIGQEVFVQAEALGLRQVDYNAIKSLPAPDQELIRRAVEETQSRDEVLDLLQELAARHGTEKHKLTKRLEDTDGELKASEERRNKLLLEKEQLELQVQKKLVAATDWPEAFKVLHDQAKHADKSIKLMVGALDAVREEALKAEPSGPDEEAAMERARAVLAEELLSIHRRCAEYLEAMGLKFEKTLGGYASEGLWK